MPNAKGEICGVGTPLNINKKPIAICVKAPNHKGDHHVMIDYRWPGDIVLVQGSILLTAKYQVASNAGPYIAIVMEAKHGS